MTKSKLKILNYSTYYKLVDNLANVMIHVLSYVTAGFLPLLLLLFMYLNKLQFYYYIDEKFHIPQTLKFCKGNFYDWDPKITTLPGLYLLAALILGPMKLCTITYLRFINVLCIYINLILVLRLVKIFYEKNKNIQKNKVTNYKLYLTSWNITFFPPLFFYFFLYYTDMFSVTLILTMLLLHFNNKNHRAGFVGFLSVCVRQTNIIWVVFIGIEKGLTIVEDITRKSHYTDTLNILPLIQILYKIFKAKTKEGIVPFIQFIKFICAPLISYLLVILLFIIFLVYNGGIVVGDRTAHVPTIHVSQILYFSVFVFLFSWPYLLLYVMDFLKFLYNNVIVSFCIVCFIGLIVHCNTLVHPYILADNRHYTFYIWKNFMNRYIYIKYMLVPVYTFAIYAILKSLSHLRSLSIVVFGICVSIVLVPQLLLEPRYFIIPYLLFRIYQKEPDNWQLVAESLTTCIINIVQFLIFINKTFHWQDEKYPQRIAW